MADGFSRTLRALEREPIRLHFWLSVALSIVIVAWFVWLFEARTSLYVLSESARLESTANPTPVQAPVDGVVVGAEVTLGRTVHEGDVLFRLDAQVFAFQQNESRAQLDAARANLAALELQLLAEEAAKDATAKNARQSTRLARAKVAIAETTADARKQESEIMQRLTEEALASRLENLRTQSEAKQTRAETNAARAEVTLQSLSGEAVIRDRDVRIATLGLSLAAATGAIRQSEARVATLGYEIERRVVRATTTGVLADIVPLSPGSTLAAGTRVATIVPTGTLRMVARFAPRDSIGRLSQGQHARLRVDNFPWTQYGTISAIVSEVGTEPRDGTVRAELAVVGDNPRIPLAHGITGSVEVEVERMAPWELLLRFAGQKMAPAQNENRNVPPSSLSAPQ